MGISINAVKATMGGAAALMGGIGAGVVGHSASSTSTRADAGSMQKVSTQLVGAGGAVGIIGAAHATLGARTINGYVGAAVLGAVSLGLIVGTLTGALAESN